MTIKLAEILRINDTLKKIIDDTNLKLDASFKFKLLGIIKNIETPIANFEVIRNEKICEYGEKDEEGKSRISSEDKEALSKFTSDLNEVLNSDVELNIQKLKASDIFNKELSSEYLVSLYPIIEE